MKTTQNKVIEWADERGLLKPENKWKQLAKLQEECGELASAMLKDDTPGIEDAIGDIQVVIAILARQMGYYADGLYEQAYEVIKNRKGKNVDGTFIRE
jgi:NTP pyrophosphatase (non-canonical NTP hydrolase)